MRSLHGKILGRRNRGVEVFIEGNLPCSIRLATAPENLVFTTRDTDSFFEKIKADILENGFPETNVSRVFANITVQYRNQNDSVFTYMPCASKRELAENNMNELLKWLKMKLETDKEVKAKLPKETEFGFFTQKSSTRQGKDRFLTGQLLLTTPRLEEKKKLGNVA